MSQKNGSQKDNASLSVLVDNVGGCSTAVNTVARGALMDQDAPPL